MIQSINHITYSVSDLSHSIQFYKKVLQGDLLVSGGKTAYFILGGVWLALNEEKDIPRNEIQFSYTHLASTIEEDEFEEWYEWLKQNHVNILDGRDRNIKDKKSVYFTDPDGHKLELHTGSLKDRLKYYKEEKPHMEFTDKGLRALK